jgi:simple sugar transport system permease protein
MAASVPTDEQTARALGVPAQGAQARLRGLIRRPEFGAFVGAIIVFAFFAFAGKNGFLTEKGTASWMNTAAELGVLAIPIGILMIAGEFDLSVGSVIGGSAMIVSIGSGYYTTPLWISVLLAVAGGAAIGLANGLIVVRTGLPSFIVTIAALFIVAGLSLGLSRALAGTTAVSLDPGGSAQKAFGSQYHDFHVSILWWIGVAIAAAVVLNKTAFGNWIFATGGSRDSARASGVPTDRVKISLFVASSTAAALVGVIQTIAYKSGDVTYGRDFVFAAPVAAVIGGVLLTGGYGSAVGVLIGTVIYGIVQVGIFYTGWNTDWAQLVLGVLLLMAVLGNNYFRRLAMSGR